MLVLRRSQNDSVTILLPDGRHVVVMVVDTSSQGIKLGFEAPKDIVINRTEVMDRHDFDPSRKQ